MPITMQVLQSAFHDYYEGLHRYAFSLTGDDNTAQDAVQQVFVALWEKKDQLAVTHSLKSYLYRAVHNTCCNLLTRSVRHRSIEELEEAGAELVGIQPEFGREIKELQLVIDRAIQSLPPNCRAIFFKSREEEKTYPVIAREMGLSVKTIEAQISKALKIIRLELHNYLYQS